MRTHRVGPTTLTVTTINTDNSTYCPILGELFLQQKHRRAAPSPVDHPRPRRLGQRPKQASENVTELGFHHRTTDLASLHEPKRKRVGQVVVVTKAHVRGRCKSLCALDAKLCREVHKLSTVKAYRIAIANFFVESLLEFCHGGLDFISAALLSSGGCFFYGRAGGDVGRQRWEIVGGGGRGSGCQSVPSSLLPRGEPLPLELLETDGAKVCHRNAQQIIRFEATKILAQALVQAPERQVSEQRVQGVLFVGTIALHDGDAAPRVLRHVYAASPASNESGYPI